MGREERALQALAKNENGAEFAILELLGAIVMSGEKAGASFQLVANVIVAKSVLNGKLPLKKRGRPKNPDGLNAYDVAIRYFAIKDSGLSYENAVGQIAATLHKDERHIMRLVREAAPMIGITAEQRTAKRKWWAYFGEMRRSRIAAGEEPYSDFSARTIKEAKARDIGRDPVAELDKLIKLEIEKVHRPTHTAEQKNTFYSSKQIKAIVDGIGDVPPPAG